MKEMWLPEEAPSVKCRAVCDGKLQEMQLLCIAKCVLKDVPSAERRGSFCQLTKEEIWNGIFRI